MNALALILSLILPACEYEDSDNCHWNAQMQGNGTGTSFVTVAGYWIEVAQ